MNPLFELLNSEEYILLDGATGTVLMADGLTSGDPPEEWNVLYPERMRANYQHYIEAGSRLILTNSFGGSRYRLKLHNLEGRVNELNKAAASQARVVADGAPHTVVVAGSIGPTGELLSPMGEMLYEEAVAAFAEQAQGLSDGGVDVFWIETMSDLNEAKAAVDGVRRVTDLPVCVTLSFDTRGHTMMGVSPAEAVETMREWDLAAMGGNCGNGIADIVTVIESMHQVAPDIPLIAKANAGLPKWVDNELIYDGTPEVMAEYGRMVRALGATLIGGCCGNGPEHIQAMAAALKQPLSEAELANFKSESITGKAIVQKNGTRQREKRGRRRRG